MDEIFKNPGDIMREPLGKNISILLSVVGYTFLHLHVNVFTKEIRIYAW